VGLLLPDTEIELTDPATEPVTDRAVGVRCLDEVADNSGVVI
jgi:hypothetical protein